MEAVIDAMRSGGRATSYAYLKSEGRDIIGVSGFDARTMGRDEKDLERRMKGLTESQRHQ